MEIVDSEHTALQAREEALPAPEAGPTAEDVAEWKAGDFKPRLSQPHSHRKRLTPLLSSRASPDKDFSSVEAAIEKKQEEINQAEAEAETENEES